MNISPSLFQKLRHAYIYTAVDTSSYSELLCLFDFPTGHHFRPPVFLGLCVGRFGPLYLHSSFRHYWPQSLSDFIGIMVILAIHIPNVIYYFGVVLALALLTIFYSLSFALPTSSFIWSCVSNVDNFLFCGSAFKAFPNRFFFIDRF